MAALVLDMNEHVEKEPARRARETETAVAEMIAVGLVRRRGTVLVATRAAQRVAELELGL